MTDFALDLDNDLWRGLDADQAKAVAGRFRPAAYRAGDRLVRQGPPSEHAVVLRAGAVDVVRELPGGQAIRLGVMGPGAVIGELGLLADSNRLASVVATEPVEAGLISASAFRAGCDLLDPALLTVARNILSIMAARLRDQSARIVAASTAAALAPPGGSEAAAPARALAAEGFDWRAFAPILPAFRHIAPEVLTALLRRVRAEDAPKGAVIAAAGAPADRACFVLRGAAAAVYRKTGRALGLNVLGPGELCGASNLIDGRASDLEYVARENTVLMTMPATDFHDILGRDDTLGLALARAAAWSLARGFARSNNTLGNFSRLARAGRSAAA